MKRYISNLFLAIMAMAAFTACSSDDDYQWATASGEQVYFSNEIASQQNISMTDGSFTIPINRVNKSGSICRGCRRILYRTVVSFLRRRTDRGRHRHQLQS